MMGFCVEKFEFLQIKPNKKPNRDSTNTLDSTLSGSLHVFIQATILFPVSDPQLAFSGFYANPQSEN